MDQLGKLRDLNFEMSVGTELNRKRKGGSDHNKMFGEKNEVSVNWAGRKVFSIMNVFHVDRGCHTRLVGIDVIFSYQNITVSQATTGFPRPSSDFFFLSFFFCQRERFNLG